MVFYCVYLQFRQAKFTYFVLVLSSSQFSLLPQKHLKTELAINMVKIDSEITIPLPFVIIFNCCITNCYIQPFEHFSFLFFVLSGHNIDGV